MFAFVRFKIFISRIDMIKVLLIGVIFMAGCTASFQPFPSVSRAEFQQTNENLVAVAQAVNKLNAQINPPIIKEEEQK